MANKSLYVGNLPYNTADDEVRAIFEPYGPVNEVRIIGQKGFGFVEIPEENADDAISALNGSDFNGRKLTVNEARPRTERSDRGGRGGGGGGYRGGGRDRGRGGGYRDRDRGSRY